MTKKRLRAAGYPRVSDEGLADSKTLESQEKEIRRYIALHNYDLQEEHMFPEAMTAYYKPYRERPQFMRLLEACRRKEIDVVIVTEFSRLSRRQEELPLLMGLIQSFGVSIESCTEEYENSSIGKFMLAARSFASELEVEKIRYRTTRGRMDRIHDGNLPGQGVPRYGWKFVDTEDETSARYVLNHDVFFDAHGNEWTAVKVCLLIVKMADNGGSLRSIAVQLTDMGIPTPRGGKIWNANTVHRIVTYEGLIGKAVALKWSRDEKHRVIRRPVEEHVLLPDGVIEPMLLTKDGCPDVELFEQVQEKLRIHKEDSLRAHKHRDELGLVRCVARCGICGNKMRVRYQSKAYGHNKTPHPPEYYCRIKRGGEELIYNHHVYIGLRALDREVWNWLLPFIKNPDLVREKVAKLRQDIHQPTNTQAVRETIAEIKRQMENLFKLAQAATDDDTIANLQVTLRELETKKRKNEALLLDEEEEEELQVKLNAELDRFEKWAKETVEEYTDETRVLTYEEKRKAVKILGLQVKVFPASNGQRHEFHLASPAICDLLSLVS